MISTAKKLIKLTFELADLPEPEFQDSPTVKTYTLYLKNNTDDLIQANVLLSESQTQEYNQFLNSPQPFPYATFTQNLLKH